MPLVDARFSLTLRSPSVRYLVNAPIEGLAIQNGRHVEVRLEAGAVVLLSRQRAPNPRLVEATWDGRSILLFADDLENRCERVVAEELP
jgi:hypothetical protein